jgi:Sulfotransferase family
MTAPADAARFKDESTSAIAAEGSAAGSVASRPVGAGRVPDFFIVGHEKCGTTALDMMLKGHPQIFLPDVKEQRFFAPELRGGRGRRRGLDSARPHTFDRYRQVFAAARPEQLVGEVSPQYLRSRGAARRIAEVQGDAKIIAILREPASFLRSFHLQWVQNNDETQKSFAKALALESARRQGKRIPRRCNIPEHLFYSDHVRYVEQLQRYHAVFPSDQILVLIYDDFRRDNEAAVRRVLRFLEVDDSLAVESVETKPLRSVRSFHLKHLAEAARTARQNPAAATTFGRMVSALTPEVLRSEAFRVRWRGLVYKQPPEPDQALLEELRRRFKPEVVALSEYLKRDLVSEWGYDRVG